MRLSLLVFAATVALTASGCDSTGIDSPGCQTGCTGTPTTPGTPGTPALTFAPLDPSATYLRTDAGTPNAVPVLLSSYGLVPGDVACFRTLGDVNLGGGTLASSTGGPVLTGAFSASTDLSATTEFDRIKDVIDGDWSIETLPVTSSGLTTNIDEDYDATNGCYPVPAGARYVFFSVFDGYFFDNTDANVGGQPFGVTIVKQ